MADELIAHLQKENAELRAKLRKTNADLSIAMELMEKYRNENCRIAPTVMAKVPIVGEVDENGMVKYR